MMKREPTIDRLILIRLVKIAIVAWLLLVGIAIVTWRSWIETRFVIVVSLLVLGPQLAWWIVVYVAMLSKGPQEMREVAVPISRRPIDETAVQQALQKLGTVACPPWVKEAVDDWLAMPQSEDKDRKRAGLLDRLYSYSALSTDDYAARSAVNQLRLAINPWVKD